MFKDIEFLKELQQELKTQENDGNASPVFWVIGDYKWQPCWEEYAERWEIYIPNYADVYEWEEYKNDQLKDNDYELSEEILDELKEIEDADTFLEWVQEYIDDRAYLVPARKEHIIVPNTMFLTKSDAKKHIELNHYHYTSEVHTYAMTAWRSPTVERLLKVLETFDWDSLEYEEKSKIELENGSTITTISSKDVTRGKGFTYTK